MEREPTVRQKHDRGYKHLLSSKQIFMELIRSFINRGWVDQIDEASLIKVDKSYILPDFRGKEADLVYRMKLKDRDVIFYTLIELQSTVDALMPWRLLSYQMEIWRQVMKDTPKKERERLGFKLPVIVPLVLFNGEEPWTAPLTFRGMLEGEQHFRDDSLVNFSYFLLDVRRYKPEDLEKLSNVIGAVFLIEQQTHAKLEEMIALFRKLAPTIDQIPPEQRDQFAIWLENVLGRLAKTRDKEKEIHQIISEIQQKGMSAVISNFEKNLEWLEEQSMLKGVEKATETVALNMLRKGLDIPFIMEMTGLPEDRVKQLQNGLK